MEVVKAIIGAIDVLLVCFRMDDSIPQKGNCNCPVPQVQPLPLKLSKVCVIHCAKYFSKFVNFVFWLTFRTQNMQKNFNSG